MIDKSWEEEDDWDTDEEDDDDFVMPVEKIGVINVRIGEVKQLKFDCRSQI